MFLAEKKPASGTSETLTIGVRKAAGPRLVVPPRFFEYVAYLRSDGTGDARQSVALSSTAQTTVFALWVSFPG
jgi:hypothetical protein